MEFRWLKLIFSWNHQIKHPALTPERLFSIARFIIMTPTHSFWLPHMCICLYCTNTWPVMYCQTIPRNFLCHNGYVYLFRHVSKTYIAERKHSIIQCYLLFSLPCQIKSSLYWSCDVLTHCCCNCSTPNSVYSTNRPNKVWIMWRWFPPRTWLLKQDRSSSKTFSSLYILQI